MRRLRAALVAVSLLALAGHARAQSVDDLKARGNQAMLDLNYADALASYEAALRLAPGEVTLHYNIGRAEQALGNYPAALAAFSTFEAEAPPETKAKVPGLAQLIADVRARVAEVSVRCSETVSGTVFLGELGRLDGCATTPKTVKVGLPTAKSLEVEVHLDSPTHLAPPQRIVLVGGGARPVDVALSVAPKTTTGLLRVSAVPASAIVALDGVPKGNPPVELELRPGAHVVDVTAESHEKRHVPFVIEVGQRKELSVTLEKTPPITKRWWFWTGAGVVAAGLATAVVILVVQPEKSAPTGTLTPGTVRAPLVTF